AAASLRSPTPRQVGSSPTAPATASASPPGPTAPPSEAVPSKWGVVTFGGGGPDISDVDARWIFYLPLGFGLASQPDQPTPRCVARHPPPPAGLYSDAL